MPDFGEGYMIANFLFLKLLWHPPTLQHSGALVVIAGLGVT